jgi:hypothetical protein
MRIFTVLLIISAFFAGSISASACTLWSAAGNAAGGGTILSKNRDWKPDHRQTVRTVHPKDGFAYFGLYAEGNDDPGMKMGINEKGLCVVSASASSIPKKERNRQKGKTGKMKDILTRCADISAVIKNKDEIFPNARANFYMCSDGKRIIYIEVGLDGKYSIKETAEGLLAHTNHYIEAGMESNNIKIGKSSTTRFARVNGLLKESSLPLTVGRFTEISRDQHDGPDNSLWRTGSKEKTLSSWILRTPEKGATELRLVIANPGEKETVQEITFDDAFWKRK